MFERPRAANAEPKQVRCTKRRQSFFYGERPNNTAVHIALYGYTAIDLRRNADAVPVSRFCGLAQRTGSLLRFGFHFTAEIRKNTSVLGREQIVHPPTLCRTNARCLQTVGKNLRHKLSASVTVSAAKTAVFFCSIHGVVRLLFLSLKVLLTV